MQIYTFQKLRNHHNHYLNLTTGQKSQNLHLKFTIQYDFRKVKKSNDENRNLFGYQVAYDTLNFMNRPHRTGFQGRNRSHPGCHSHLITSIKLITRLNLSQSHANWASESHRLVLFRCSEVSEAYLVNVAIVCDKVFAIAALRNVETLSCSVGEVVNLIALWGCGYSKVLWRGIPVRWF